MAAQRRPGGGPPWANIGVPMEKASSFGPSARRLLGRLAPERLGVVVVLVLGVVSVALNVVGPVVLGWATNVIFAGVLGRQLPAGLSTAQAAADARAAGDDTMATLIESQGVVPGAGVDFAALGRVLLLVVAIYVAASLLAYLQGWLLNGIVQRTIADAAPRRGGQAAPAAAGLRRLAAARGAAQPGHQRHRQRLAEPAADDEPAADVAADGGRRARDDGGDLAAARGDRAADRAAVGVDDPGDREAVAGAVRRAVALHGRAERADRGGVHRPRARHGVRAAGRGRGGVRGEERRAARRGLPVAVRLRDHHAVDDVPREPQLRRGRRGRRAARHGGRDDAGRGAGVHPVLPAVHAAAHAGGVDGEPAAVRRGLGRAGVRAARRARADARAGQPCAAHRALRAGGVRARVVPLPARRPADRRPLAGRRARADGRDRGADRRGQDHAGEPRDAVLRARRRPDHARRRRHHAR